eukprot:3101097-Pleurochrysis_carterae.AAC.1
MPHLMSLAPFSLHLPLPAVSSLYRKCALRGFLAAGARQGFPMDTFLFCLSFHAALIATQQAHPDVMSVAFGDGDYAVGAPPCALSAQAAT